MADDPTNSNPVSDQPASPAASPAEDKREAPADKNAPDPVKMAEELGKTKAELETLKKYQQEVDPVIQTIWSDQDTLKKVTEVHNKRLGVTPDPDKPTPDNTPVKPSPVEVDNRNALTKQIVNEFYGKHGADKLEPEKKKELDQKIGAQLGEMLDPGGNKTLQQIFDTVSLTKLPQYLDNAYFLATRMEQMEEAKNQGKQEASQQGIGVIGSIPSSSPDIEQTVLTQKQKEIAHNLGVSEEKYLQRVKEIAVNKSKQLF